MSIPLLQFLLPALLLLLPLLWLPKLRRPLAARLAALHAGLRRPVRQGGSGQVFPPGSAEPRMAVNDTTHRIPRQRQNMLLNALEQENVTVNDVMVTRNDVVGIDLDEDIDDILQALSNSSHTRLPVYNRDLNNVVGILHIRSAARLMVMDEPTKAELLQHTREPYFVPESTPLTTQLVNFQKTKHRMALVVDEYGDVKGIVTLEDVLEEIVGNFTRNFPEATTDIHPQPDGSYLIDGGTSIREVNRTLGWDLPTDGPKTLSGLLTELLESIPDNHVGIRLPGHCVEIIQVKDNIIKTVRMWRLAEERNDDAASEIQANLFD